MEGLIEEGEEMIDNDDIEDEARDAGLISAGQRVEHYEIAAYGTVRTFANILGDREAVSLLESTLDEEKETDQKLNKLAEHINLEAAHGGEMGETGEMDTEEEEAGQARRTASVGRSKTRGSRGRRKAA